MVFSVDEKGTKHPKQSSQNSKSKEDNHFAFKSSKEDESEKKQDTDTIEPVFTITNKQTIRYPPDNSKLVTALQLCSG